MSQSLKELFADSDRFDRYLTPQEIDQRNVELLQVKTDLWWEVTDQGLIDEIENEGEEFMVKSIDCFGGDYENPAISKFSEKFETATGDCLLSGNDQRALVAVLGVHAWGIHSCLEGDFATNVFSAIGDGVETTLETEDPTAPLAIALECLSSLTDAAQCYSLMQWLIG